MAVLAQSTNFIFEVPNGWAFEGEMRRRVRAGVKGVIDATNKRLLRAAQAAYSFEPLQSSWHTATQSSPFQDSFIAGIYTDDPLLPIIVQNTVKHMPPPNRGAPLTGIEGWVFRLQGPQPGYEKKITVWLVRKSIADHGTKAKDAIIKIWEQEAVVFGHNVEAAIYRAVTSDDFLV